MAKEQKRNATRRGFKNQPQPVEKLEAMLRAMWEQGIVKRRANGAPPSYWDTPESWESLKAQIPQIISWSMGMPIDQRDSALANATPEQKEWMQNIKTLVDSKLQGKRYS